MIEFFQGGRVFIWNGLHSVNVMTKTKTQFLGSLVVGDLSRPKADLDDVHDAIDEYVKVNGRLIS